MQAVVRGIGLDPATGYHLRNTFLDAGLPEPEMNVCSPVGGGPDFPGYDYGAESLRSMLPLILKLGIATEEEVEYRHPGPEASRRNRGLGRRDQDPRPCGRVDAQTLK